jgi:hypothetical protein
MVLVLSGCCGDEHAGGDSADGGLGDAAAGDAGASDGAPADAGVGAVDAGGPPMTCVFNRECPATDRCECDSLEECICQPGARGTGRNGLDRCTSGNDCASSVCSQGSDGGYYCSGECADDSDCEENLPRCLDVALIGRICVRSP